MGKALLVFGCFLAFGFSTWYFAHPSAYLWQQSPVNDDEPDMLIEKITALQFDQTGQLSHQIEATQLIHYPRENKSILTKPRIILSYKNQAPWVIQSEQGIANHKMEQFILQKQVVLQQAASARNEAHTIRTEQLFYYPAKKLATTLLPIAIEKPGMTINAIGINAYMEQKQLQLLSNVAIDYQKVT